MKKVSNIEKEYKKQIRRIKNAIRRLEKQGFEIENKIPKVPKRITKASIRNLQRITPEKLREKSRFIDVQTGELIKYTSKKNKKRIKEIRQRNEKQKSYRTKTDTNIIERIKKTILELPDERGLITTGRKWKSIDLTNRKNTLYSLFNDVWGTFDSDNDFARFLELNEMALLTDFDVIIYDSQQENVERSYANVISIFNSVHPLSIEEMSNIT